MFREQMSARRLLVNLLVTLFFVTLAFSRSGWATDYYVNCSLGTNGNGSSTSPWNNIASANAQTLSPGDSLLFARGTTCDGELTPNGSGSSSAVITIDAYGTGALPILDGGTTNASTLLLNDEEYYQINNLAIRGSKTWAVNITGSTAGKTLHHIYLANLDITAVNTVATQRSGTGLLQFYPNACGEQFDDGLVDGVTVHDTTAAEGISMAGAGYCKSGTQTFGGPITVQNSISHDVYGDGIISWDGAQVVMQNNVVYNTGECTSCKGSTPVGLWSWYSQGGVIAQNNESYSNHTWSNKDGGSYDIDYWNADNTYQYNYGHDSDGYCVSVFGHESGSTLVTTNAIVRYNICANNAQKDTGIGEIYTFTWGKGNLNGVQIYNNTIYLNGVAGSYAITDQGTYTGSTPNFIKNNLIYTLMPNMLSATTNMVVDNNLYWNASSSPSYSFTYGSTTYSSFSAYQTGSHQDAHGLNTDPLVNGAGYHSPGRPTLTSGYWTLQNGSPAIGSGADVCAVSCIGGTMGAQDFYGQALGTTHNIGAYD